MELTLPDNLAERFDLMRERMEIHTRQEDMAALVQELDQMETLADALDDNVRRALCVVHRAQYASRIDDYPGAIAAAGRAIAFVQAAIAPSIVIDAYLVLEAALAGQGDYKLRLHGTNRRCA